MTNWDHWQNSTSGLSSPQNYVDWGFLSMVSSALQRRVWCSADHQQCFPSMYVILVGEAGIGKGLILKEVSHILRYWKLSQQLMRDDVLKEAAHKAQAEHQSSSMFEKSREKMLEGPAKDGERADPLLIPMGPDATTYEALTLSVGLAYRIISHVEYDEEKKRNMCKSYGHSSICFVLQEVASLLKKHTDAVVAYLLGVYDCPFDYEYDTVKRGLASVRKGCVNILAGTTPSYMQTIMDAKLIDQGFTSRTFFVFANRNRKNQFFIPPLNDSQKKSRQHIIDYVRKLTTVYGAIKLPKSTTDFLEDWYAATGSIKEKRVNTAPQMASYYSRKNIHVMKIAMAKHFSESLEMDIPLSTFEWAIEFLEKEEKNMHLALILECDNVQAKAAKKILALLESGPKTRIQILLATYGLCRQVDSDEALEFLIKTGQVVTRNRSTDDSDMQEVTYILKELA